MASVNPNGSPPPQPTAGEEESTNPLVNAALSHAGNRVRNVAMAALSGTTAAAFQAYAPSVTYRAASWLTGSSTSGYMVVGYAWQSGWFAYASPAGAAIGAGVTFAGEFLIRKAADYACQYFRGQPQDTEEQADLSAQNADPLVELERLRHAIGADHSHDDILINQLNRASQRQERQRRNSI